MNKFKINLIVLFSLFFVGCAGTSPPKWFDKIPCKKNYVCGVGFAKGERRQFAIAEANQNAAISIGTSLNQSIQGLIRQAGEEINDESAINNFQLMAETILDINLKDTEVVKQKIDTKRNVNYAYILIQYNESKANERLLRKIDEDKKLYDAFRTTQLYDDLKKKVDEYRAQNSGQ